LRPILSLAVIALCLSWAVPAFCEGPSLWQDPQTGQLYTKPADGRVPVDVVKDLKMPESAMGGLYEDANGTVYTKPGEGRKPVAMVSQAPAAPQASEAREGGAADYSTKAFSDAVKHVIGEEEAAHYPKLKIGALAYVNYFYDFDKEKLNPDGSKGARNNFELTRGYINFNADLTPEIFFRFTPDITRITSSSNSQHGDLALRVKYLYVGFKDFLDFYPSFQAKLGQFQGAWLDHEEALWTYRVQGTMLIEREGFMNSANLGVDFQGKLPNGFGEWQFNVDNGEGYHLEEQNKYKSVQARVTLHPLPNNEYTKGFEVTGFTFFGRKDRHTSRDMYDVLLGYKLGNDLFVGGEYLFTHGADSFVTHTGKTNIDGGGLSLLGWCRMPFWNPIRVMGRWDHFDHDLDAPNNTVNRYVAGVSYDFGKYVTVLLNWERTVAKAYKGGFASATSYPDQNLAKLDVQVGF
jgi:hypothetical protein